jgi:hypothetical protein
MNYTYTIIVGPNPFNDNPTPWNLISNLTNSTILKDNLSKNLPSWNKGTDIPFRVILLFILVI